MFSAMCSASLEIAEHVTL